MFLLTFYGAFCAVWLFYMLCGYPVWSYNGTDMNVMRVCRIITIVSTLFFVYIVFSQYWAGGIKQFAGMSVPIILLLVMIFCRQVADLFFLHYDHPLMRSFLLLIFPITLLAFSVPLKPESAKKYFACVYIPLFILSIIIIVTWWDLLISGLTLRSLGVESKIIDSLFRGTHLKVLRHPALGIAAVTGITGTIGALLCILSMFLVLQKKKILNMMQIIFIIGYAMGCTIVFFTSYRSNVLGIIAAGLFIVCSCKFLRSWQYIIKVLIFLIIGGVLFSVVGYKDKGAILKRYLLFSKNVSKNIDEIISESTPGLKPVILPESKSTVVSESKSVTSKPDILVNPYTLKERPGDHGNPYYNKLTQAMKLKDARNALYALSIQAIMQYPLIGYGQNLIVNLDGHIHWLSVHSNVLTIFMSIGIFGGILFLYVIFRGVLDSVVIARYIPEFSWLSAIFLFAFVANIFYTACIEYAILWVPLVAMRSCVKFNVPKIKQEKNCVSETLQ
jgi:hypothetical protein